MNHPLITQRRGSQQGKTGVSMKQSNLRLLALVSVLSLVLLGVVLSADAADVQERYGATQRQVPKRLAIHQPFRPRW